MIDTIYVEEEIKDHPRTKDICSRFPNARRIGCGRYGEVFNPKAQNFRLQKLKPALILAKKFKNFVLDVPENYGIGGSRNYYFSHMLNCIYDCRYCFLQGMYESAHYVLFVNYEDFEEAIDAKISETPAENTYFFSGYDCDSLALEPISHFADHFIPFFEARPKAWLELRTKSIQVHSLAKRKAVPNVIAAFSLNPKEVAEALEHKAPSIENRLCAMEELAARGWKLGLRFDPFIYHENFLAHYKRLFETTFKRLPVSSIHSVSLGLFRLPKEMYERIYKLYPDERLFSGPLEEKKEMVSYLPEIEKKMSDGIIQLLSQYVPDDILFPCGTLQNC